MKRFIAPQILRVGGQPAPCECTDNIVCAYCVQANLILWERREHPADERNDRLCEAVRKFGVRRVAKNLDIRHATVAGWLKSGRINPSYLASVDEVVRGEG